jgi:hypothetical protein
MKKYIVVDNFFNEPDSFRNFALQQKFYDKENHPHDGLDAFPGKRTDYFNDTNSQFFKDVNDKIRQPLCELDDVNDLVGTNVNCLLQISFSYTLKGMNTPIHTDPVAPGYKSRYGGVVYLNPEITWDRARDTGTTLYLKEETINIENKYNRLLLYNSNIKHQPTDNFGDDINNSRLVMTIFYDLAPMPI